MPNFFTDNLDLLFHFEHLDMKNLVAILENDYCESKEYNYAPIDYEDAIENYRKVLEITGNIAGDFVAPRAADVDIQGNTFVDGKVTYAKGIQESFQQLSQAELMGMSMPRKYGGLNFPITVYMMAIEVISRADASMMNLFGLQDIAMTIYKFGDNRQRAEFLPKFASGEHTGAMALTEPDAGSDLQSTKLQAYQDEKGNWFLKGVKRFITNGCADILLVVARSEPNTKDARGLSLFACYGKDNVKIRRIEDKLGIHGSPTCELQFNDTPAQLIGKRKLGLIKYVMELMNGARLAIAAQALGIAQAAYEKALEYAKSRIQFGTAIYRIPVVSNMLIDMKVALESSRSLIYSTSKWVDQRDTLEILIERLKREHKSQSDENVKLNIAKRVANLLTPLTKYVITESANKICYNSLQIHGGAGYMKDFAVERLLRDARITNIYEGTSQMQIVAASGGVINDILGEHFSAKEKKIYKVSLKKLANYLKEIRRIFLDCLKFVLDKKDSDFQDVAARNLVEIYSYIFIGYLLLDEAEIEKRKIFVANRYIIGALSKAIKRAEEIKKEQFSDLIHADEILI